MRRTDLTKTVTINLTEEEGDTLTGALAAASQGQKLTDEERETLKPIAVAFRRHDVLIRVMRKKEEH